MNPHIRRVLRLLSTLLLCVAPSMEAAPSLDLTDAFAAAPIQLLVSGDWDFRPADAAVPQGPDARAAELAADPGEGWHGVAVPQFLNRTVWWLQHISPAYAQQEIDRVAALPFDAESTYAGWYRRTLKLPALAEGEARPEVRVHFEGVAMVSRVYLNGERVGGYVGMFGGFDCRLTDALRFGEDNQLLVHVERGSRGENDTEVVDVAVTVPVTRDMLTSSNSGMFGGFGRGARAKSSGRTSATRSASASASRASARGRS